MYAPVLVTAPAIKPVTTAEVKSHLRVTGSTDDALIDTYIASATSQIDGWSGILGRCLCEQTWRQDYDCFERRLCLPLYPVISVSSVKYDDLDGVSQTINPSNYSLQNDDLGAFVKFKTTYGFAALNIERPALHVEYVAGYADDGAASTVPDAIKAAIKLIVGNLYWQGEQSPFLSLRRIEGIGERRYVRSADSLTAIEKTVDNLLAPFRRSRV